MNEIRAGDVLQLIKAGETDRLELKREWWDFESKIGKASFSKDVLAMANTLTEGQTGHILIGVEDPKVGGRIVGVATSPSQETVAQILTSHTSPVPKVRLGQVLVDEKKISILEVVWDDSHPYFSIRDVDSALSSDAVYVRRSGTIARLKPFEFERLIRAKDARLGKLEADELLVIGFLELPVHSSDRISFRIGNSSEESITDINVCADIVCVGPERPLHSFHRMRLLNDLTLQPAETREMDFFLSNASFLDSEGRYARAPTSSWFDIQLRVRYRARDGLLRETSRAASVW